MITAILPEILAICGLLISSIVFYLYAKTVSKERFTLDGFTLADRKLGSKQFSNTFAASSFSLALIVLFYFSIHRSYGLFLLICPISYLAGHYLFLWLLNTANVDLKECRTLSDLCYMIFPSKAIARLITAMTLCTFLMTLFIELYIGSVVFSIFLPNNVFYQTLSFFSLGFLALLYVRLGGYKALVKTDKWQLSLTMLAMSSLFIFSMVTPLNAIKDTTNVNVLYNMLSFTENPYGIISFFIWLITINPAIHGQTFI